MNKEIHWLLHSLNEHLHYLDEAEKAYPHLQDLNEENIMWRKKYAEDQQYSKKQTQILLCLPTNYFLGRTPEEVYKDFIQGK